VNLRGDPKICEHTLKNMETRLTYCMLKTEKEVDYNDIHLKEHNQNHFYHFQNKTDTLPY
jgi:hypothetical protein